MATDPRELLRGVPVVGAHDSAIPGTRPDLLDYD
jgi:hypothetical protein